MENSKITKIDRPQICPNQGERRVSTKQEQSDEEFDEAVARWQKPQEGYKDENWCIRIAELQKTTQNMDRTHAQNGKKK